MKQGLFLLSLVLIICSAISAMEIEPLPPLFEESLLFDIPATQWPMDEFQSLNPEQNIINESVTKNIANSVPRIASLSIRRAFRLKKQPYNKSFPCPYSGCDYVAKQAWCLVRHIRTHTGERPYKCPYSGCDYAAKQAYHLATHIRIHKGERPYKCDYPGCDYAAKQAENLAKHIRTHTGERPYKCSYSGCDYAATRRSDLKRHIRIHKGERPFKCVYPGCNYAAVVKSHLTRHMRIHE